jgi:hypothetical protein
VYTLFFIRGKRVKKQRQFRGAHHVIEKAVCVMVFGIKRKQQYKAHVNDADNTKTEQIVVFNIIGAVRDFFF